MRVALHFFGRALFAATCRGKIEQRLARLNLTHGTRNTAPPLAGSRATLEARQNVAKLVQTCRNLPHLSSVTARAKAWLQVVLINDTPAIVRSNRFGSPWLSEVTSRGVARTAAGLDVLTYRKFIV